MQVKKREEKNAILLLLDVQLPTGLHKFTEQRVRAVEMIVQQRKQILILEEVKDAHGAAASSREAPLASQLCPANRWLTGRILRGIQGHLVPQGQVVHGLRSGRERLQELEVLLALRVLRGHRRQARNS
jgi:hypothetical protein